MNKTQSIRSLLLSVLFTAVCLFSHSALDSAESSSRVVYAQLSSSLSQQIPNNTNQLVSMANEDALAGIYHPSPDKVVIKEAGTYVLLVAGQAGVAKQAKAASGYVDMWLVLNGKIVPNSGVRQYLEKKDSTSVLIFQTVSPFEAGDSISIGFTASNPMLGLITTDATAKEPAIPSVIFSLFKL